MDAAAATAHAHAMHVVHTETGNGADGGPTDLSAAGSRRVRAKTISKAPNHASAAAAAAAENVAAAAPVHLGLQGLPIDLQGLFSQPHLP